MYKAIQIVSIERHHRSRIVRFPEKRRLEIRRTVGGPSSDIDGSGAEQVLGIHFGDGGCESELNGREALEVGEWTGVVGYGVALEDLRRVRM